MIAFGKLPQPMVFDFVSGPDFNFLTSFGQQYGIPVEGDQLTIPPTLGKGFIRKVDLGPSFKLLIHQYTLHEELVLKRRPFDRPFDLISILVHGNEEPISLTTPGSQVQLARNNGFAVQIASTDLESVVRFPANVPIEYVVIGLSSTTLKQLLRTEPASPVMQTILSGAPGFLFYESMGPDVKKLLDQLTAGRPAGELSAFFYHVKVEELLYLVIEKLLRRETVYHRPVNRAAIDKLFAVRSAVLADLDKPPHLPQLARLVGMSQTKLKELFKQVFGDSIYAHFQKARMEEAAALLRQGDYSVSEVGYRLGFTNLSHFSRLFYSHYGVRPKTYTSGG